MMNRFRKSIKALDELAKRIAADAPPDPLANIQSEKTRRAVKDYLRNTPPLKQFEAALRNEHPLQIFGTCDHIAGDVEDITETYRQELEKLNAWWKRRERIRDTKR